MDVTTNIEQLRRKVKKAKLEGNKVVGFVPTMGYLHDGHLSLVKAAKDQTDFVVVSIFVNPTQFAPTEDFSQYPRDLDRDKALLNALGVDVLFHPSVEQIYPKPYRTYVEVLELDKYLCGAKRPGHFRGVCTIVAKLFNIVQPDVAYFGQKDIQQARIIQQMVRDLNFPIDIKIMPIVREDDGLAMSSRNVYLNKEQRSQANILYKSLSVAKEMILNGEVDVSKVIRKMENMIKGTSGIIDYIEIVDYETLVPIKYVEAGKKLIIAVAVWFGKARLIDNFVIIP